MSFLDDLSADQRQMLVSLPYRVGIYVSQSDVSGGADSDAQELQALSNILGGFAGEVFTSETVQYVITETLRQQEHWAAWNKLADEVIADCRRAIDVLNDHVEEKEVNAFKQHLMEVGEAVALAFREVEDLSFSKRLALKIQFMKLEYMAKKQGHVYKTFDEFLNISSAERAVLEDLASALEIDYAV